MKLKNILITPILMLTLLVSGCEISLYRPDSSKQDESQQSALAQDQIHKINPSSYNGTINYYQGNEEKLSSEEVYQKGVSSTVYIIAKNESSSFGGSGIFFSEDSNDDGYAYIFTNAHVVENAISIEVVYSNYKRDTATLVGYHVLEDVAVLAVRKNNNYTIATVNPTNNLSVGEEVLAIGTPISTDYSFVATKGIVSKLDSPITSTVDESYQLLLLQTDTTLNHGSSGGPLFDMYGNVIGLNSLKLLYDDNYSSVEDFYFSIPIERAIFMANKFFNNQYFNKGLIGVSAIDITELSLATRETYGISLEYGLYIDDAGENTLIKKGDIITKINNIEFLTRIQFQKELYKFAKNETIELTIFSNQTYSTITVTLR